MSSLFSINTTDTRQNNLTRYAAAVRFIERRIGQYPDHDQLVRRCAAYLMSSHDVTDRGVAQHWAANALGEVQARHVPALIDANSVSSYAVKVIDPVRNEVAVFTASELLQLARERAGTTPDPAYAVSVCGRSATLA